VAVLADQRFKDTVQPCTKRSQREENRITQRIGRLLLPGPEGSTGVQTTGHQEMKKLYKKITSNIIYYVRPDLQLHFLWAALLTLFAIFWQPLIYLGLVATIIKEGLDLWSKGHWSWDDFVFGVLGWLTGGVIVTVLI
jgi:hypothetical protein